MKKVFTGAMAAVVMAGTLMASMGSAEAGWRYRRGWHGGAVAAGVIGALAIGAIAASAAPRPYYVYGCHIERRPVYNAWGDVVGFRRIRVC
ncbi:MAG: hypothetical protein JNK46_16700 [Methylobacteriaceae bacterium]|nr:hypothetical protein [Methylobacteriaceae bacterium]